MKNVLGVVMLSVIVLMGGCAGTYAEVGMGHNDNWFGGEDWTDGGAGLFGATFEVGQEWDVPKNPNMKVKCRYMHVSQWTVGPPWNDDLESSLDHVGCAVRYKLDKRLF